MLAIALRPTLTLGTRSPDFPTPTEMLNPRKSYPSLTWVIRVFSADSSSPQVFRGNGLENALSFGLIDALTAVSVLL